MHHYRRYPEQVGKSRRDNVIRNESEDIYRYLVDNILVPASIWWIDEWYNAKDTLNLSFTTFEEFATDRAKFTERIIGLYGGDTRYFNKTLAAEEHSGVDYHKRLGAIDEWRHVLNQRQIKEINDLIPDRLWNAFGWKP